MSDEDRLISDSLKHSLICKGLRPTRLGTLGIWWGLKHSLICKGLRLLGLSYINTARV